MSTTAAVPEQAVMEALARDFGTNTSFAVEVFERYEQDPTSVEPSWQEYFDRLRGGEAKAPRSQRPPSAPPSRSLSVVPPPSAERARTPQQRSSPAAITPSGRKSQALATTAILPGDIAEPIRGGTLRLVENMEASLAIPTATSVRTIPVRTLEENRRLLNKHRDPESGKVTVAHIVAWAILRALEAFPRLNDAYTEVDGAPHRVHRDTVRLGVAIDVSRRDGSRSLLVPNVKDAHSLTFAQLVRAFDDLVRRARSSSLSPDDFFGTTVSYTNPGTVGTTTSAPRLMPGQGVIVATGAMDYPAEYRSMPERTLALLGISKVMTLTSTYDHRIIQGAESGLFLARMEELLRGEDGFYDRMFDELHVPHRPVRWEIDTTPALLGGGGADAQDELIAKQARVLQLIRAFRVRGHLVANLDPLQAQRDPHPELDPATYGLTMWDLDREFFTDGLGGRERGTLRETLEVLRETYCGTVAAEYMHIADPERKVWLQQRMESTRNRAPFEAEARRRLLERLIESETFERFLHTRYLGHKRFSIEGCESLIPLLCRLISDAARSGVSDAFIGMSHRGRLNVLHNVVHKPLAQIFSEFEESRDPDSTQGSGDVKYHLGARGVHHAGGGEPITVTVAPNPSHLEFVNPVVEGMARARQESLNDTERTRVMPILLHGDAAFSGQGIVAETLNLSLLPGYTTGGTVHVVVNNQIGFTTPPESARSSTYCTDVARMVQAPILHVNADDPEACLHAAALAFEYRQRFRRDIVIDLVGYRRWGHNEGDEPAYTQPLLYARIQSHPAVAELYAERLIRDEVVTREDVSTLWASVRDRMSQTGETGFVAAITRRPPLEPARIEPDAMRGRLRAVLTALSTPPEDVTPHPKLVRLLKHRAEILEGQEPVDWATAEALAFGTLLIEGIPVRLSGQDSGRGTFSQRHAVLYDVRSGRPTIPLNRVASGGARLAVHDSSLSEASVMGFEYGYSVIDHHTLVIWEAQFGDFVNAAQVIVDQFVAASEAKWGQPSGLVLFLPHGHEGQGPEHSSARLERFLILCAEDNMRVAWPSTPAQLFGLLRRQGRDAQEKPLVVLTPKSLLRHPRCVSSIDELTTSRFHEILDDATVAPDRTRRVILTGGKLYYDLLAQREKDRAETTAIVRIEQIYPFPAQDLAAILRRYPEAAELVWAQEEPQNMGAWRFVRERFLDGDVQGFEQRVPRYVGRPPSAAPAPGTQRAHVREQEAIVRSALG